MGKKDLKQGGLSNLDALLFFVPRGEGFRDVKQTLDQLCVVRRNRNPTTYRLGIIG